MEAEKILEMYARKHMIRWNQNEFKSEYKRLHKAIIESINHALKTPVPIRNKSEHFYCLEKIEYKKEICQNQCTACNDYQNI